MRNGLVENVLDPKNPAPTRIVRQDSTQHRAEDTGKCYNNADDSSECLQEPLRRDFRENDDYGVLVLENAAWNIELTHF